MHPPVLLYRWNMNTCRSNSSWHYALSTSFEAKWIIWRHSLMNQHCVHSRDTKLFIITKMLNSGRQNTSWQAASGKITLYGIRQLLLWSHQSATGTIASEMNSVYFLQAQLLKKRFNIIFQSTPWSRKWPLPFKLSDRNFTWNSHLSNTCYMSCQFHRLWVEHPNNTWWAVHMSHSARCSQTLSANNRHVGWEIRFTFTVPFELLHFARIRVQQK